METMKVYIKPWVEALKEAKKHEGFVKFFPDRAEILGVSRRMGDWGYICTVTKNSDDEHTSYTVVRSRSKDIGFTYDACCVEEITPNWLEEHASKFSEEVFVTDTWDNNFENYETHRITIYKAVDGMHAYFFYVKRVSYNGCEETVEDFRVIN